MAQDLPGFYFDPEKNRYFPIKGPIPGSSRKQTTPLQNSDSLITKVSKNPKKDVSISKLVHLKELCGNFVGSSYGKVSFQEECKKQLVSNPKVWKYQNTHQGADCSLGLLHITVETPQGQCATDALIAGDISGSVNLFDVGGIGQYFSHGMMSTAVSVWPERDEPNSHQSLKNIWLFDEAALMMPSSVSSICAFRKVGTDNDSFAPQQALITTLGSEYASGGLYIVNLADPVELDSLYFSDAAMRRFSQHISLNCTVWEANIGPCGRQAVVGTSLGAKMVDLESGVSSMICSSKSDVLSVQLIQSGNVALCGLRNGTIVTVDARQRQRQLARHRIPCSSNKSSTLAQKKTTPFFVLRGDIQPSCTVYMPSSICCLESLQLYDQYFLASSMDGSINLYDHRLTNRGPVQSYEGQVNSHSRIKLAADASESFIISGGEDCKVRVWNINSGKMLFEEKFMNSISMSVLWQGNAERICKGRSSEEGWHAQTPGWNAWLGSGEGLFRMQFCS